MNTASRVPSRNWRTIFVGTPLGWALSIVLALLGGYLFITHAGHVLSALPYLILLACPLMHLFGHGQDHADPDHGRKP